MPADDKIAAILSSFPGPVTLYPSRKKWLFLFSAGALFSAGGLAMARSGETVGWYMFALFGIVALIPLVVMLPGSGWLVLDRDGFDYKTIFISKRARWRDASNFRAGKIPPAGTKLVLYDDASTTGLNADLTTTFTGRNSTLGDTYGFSPDDLARLMAQWRERAVGQSGPR